MVLKPMQTVDASFVLVSLVDVTERRQNERTAARQRDEIAHLSRVAALGELSGSLAHEINQPLMGILSNAQAAQRFLARDDVNLDEVRQTGG
jgi:two-component system sensor kinase FixL